MTSASSDLTAATAPSEKPGVHRCLVWLWLIAGLVLVVDQITKVLAVSLLSGGQRVPILGKFLSLVLIRNAGAAFSFATGQTWIFTIVALVAAVVIIRISKRLAALPWAVALGLVLGGAVGNLIDRLVRSPGIFRGHVVDFIDYNGYFVGNVADIAIVVAAVLIIVLTLWGIDFSGKGTRRTATDVTA